MCVGQEGGPAAAESEGVCLSVCMYAFWFRELQSDTFSLKINLMNEIFLQSFCKSTEKLNFVLVKQVGCFNHRVVTLVACKLHGETVVMRLIITWKATGRVHNILKTLRTYYLKESLQM